MVRALRSYRDIVATRTLTLVGEPASWITLVIHKPRRVGTEEWQCPIVIHGLKPKPILDATSGVDSLQALLLAAECIRSHLERSGREFAWLGDSELMGIGGIPRQISPHLGKEFDRRIERAMIREIDRTRKYRAPIMRRLFLEGKQSEKRRMAPRNAVARIGKRKARDRPAS